LVTIHTEPAGCPRAVAGHASPPTSQLLLLMLMPLLMLFKCTLHLLHHVIELAGGAGPTAAFG